MFLESILNLIFSYTFLLDVLSLKIKYSLLKRKRKKKFKKMKVYWQILHTIILNSLDQSFEYCLLLLLVTNI